MAGNLPRTDPGRTSRHIEEITDPTERIAAQRLQQAIQRIQTNRDRHAGKPGAGRGDPANQNGRRDW
jgi:plasmid stabilization system protein ParE